MHDTNLNASTSSQRLPSEFEVPLDGAPYDDSDGTAAAERLKAEEWRQLLDHSDGLLRKETTQLLNEIDRLEMTRLMLDRRLGNVMALAFSSVNIEDSKRMARMTETSLKDNAVMRQIAYLTMFFLPATFVANVFSMNIAEINPGTLGTLAHYFATAIPMTVVTVIVMMIQYRYTKRKAAAHIHTDGVSSMAFNSMARRSEKASVKKSRWWPGNALSPAATWSYWMGKSGTESRREGASRRHSRMTGNGPMEA